MNKVLHIRVSEETIKQLEGISTKEARTFPNVVRLALEEIGTRGWTDKLPKRERK